MFKNAAVDGSVSPVVQFGVVVKYPDVNVHTDGFAAVHDAINDLFCALTTPVVVLA